MNSEVRKVLSKGAFMVFFRALEIAGFIRLSRQEILDSLKNTRAWAAFRKKSEGIETGYVYRHNEKMIFVWSTYSSKLNGPKEHDEGWVVIIDLRNPRLFFSYPMKRTTTFLERLMEQVIAYKELVDKWPRCPYCSQDLFLDLSFDENRSKMYFFTMHHQHPKMPAVYFNLTETPISSKNLSVLSVPFLRNKNYRKHNAERNTQQAIRYAVRNGIAVPKKSAPYNDLSRENHPENFIDAPHDDSGQYYD